MGFTDEGTPSETPPANPPVRLAGALPVEPVIPPASSARVNWLFSGVLLGAASWLLVLGAVFAATGNWIIAGAMVGGIAWCGLGIWRAGRRLHRTATSGRHRAETDSAVG